jgi:YidC/Oxa1 family membrane protein insertase
MMLNGLFWLYSVLGHSFGLSIIMFTILVRVITFPFTLQQLRSAKATQDIQPKLQELQKKFKDDKQKLGEEQMKLYKEAGINPLGCLVPTLLQFPVWIGLYQSIMSAAPDNPMQLLNLAKHIGAAFSHLVPLNANFLGLNLGRPFPLLAILVVATQWALQKMTTPATATPEQAAQNRSMELTMPMVFGFITMNLASGLGLYFITTNILGMVQQYFVTGWGSLEPLVAQLGLGKASATKDKGHGRAK